MSLHVLDTDTLVTRNVRDFQAIPDLIVVDWST